LHDLSPVGGGDIVALPGKEFAYPGDGLVFSALDGQALSPNAVSKSFTSLVRKLGVTPITFHGLRHTHITHLLMDGVPIKVVSERAGHSKVSHTLDLYGHVLPDMQESAAALVDREFAKAFLEHERNMDRCSP
jgi:integrase